MIIRQRRPIQSRKRTGNRVRPGNLDFPQIRKEVRVFQEVGIILKDVDVFRVMNKFDSKFQ